MELPKSCWTCKARKVQCDRATPNCQKCVRGKRKCQGYDFRLSWPKDNDRRRAIIGVPSVTIAQVTHGHRFIHTSFKDVELYQYMSLQSMTKPPEITEPIIKLWKQPYSTQTHMDLIYRFRDVASHSLLSFSSTASQLRDVIMPMALAHDTASGQAVLYAMLAFASIHRSGLHQQTMQFKISALRALSVSADQATDRGIDAAHHIATCMLLCAFELMLPSESSGDWLRYTQAATDLVQRTQLTYESDQGDVSCLLDWVFYHHTISRFATYHWRHQSEALAYPSPISSESENESESDTAMQKIEPVLRSSNPSHEILNLLSELCDVLLHPLDPRSRSEKYQAHIRSLEWSIVNLPASSSQKDLGSEVEGDNMPLPIQMYQRATIVYLLRASQSPWESPANLDNMLAKSFAERVKAPSCSHFFPLFILACEARTDEQRTSIVDLIERTERTSQVRSMARFKAGIQSFWVQRDLHADSDLLMSYMDLMKQVVSSGNILPSFA
ncbi:fungal-specific transcription factor domain-containing protein [Xylariaceae sp. FL0016]|nr:fungal-specific transcription factor domain-containing protein [Xylariaceae sp. FL0016]